MAKLFITLGDDNNKEYRKKVEVKVDGTTYDDYEHAWDNILDAIEAQYPDLPRNWFVDHIER